MLPGLPKMSYYIYTYIYIYIYIYMYQLYQSQYIIANQDVYNIIYMHNT